MSRVDLVLHVEAALLSAGRPVAIDELMAMFEGRADAPDRRAIRDALDALAEHWRDRSMELGEVASGFRAQIRKEYSRSIASLWQERPARYSRALLETLALIAYRQPVSRGEIEEVRGVSVSSSIMKTLLEREWVRVVGHREVPGRPALYGTTKHFLDTFNLKGLEALPPLAELRELEDPPPDLFAGLAEPPGTGEVPDSRGTIVGVEAGVHVESGGLDSPASDQTPPNVVAEPVGETPGEPAARQPAASDWRVDAEQMDDGKSRVTGSRELDVHPVGGGMKRSDASGSHAESGQDIEPRDSRHRPTQSGEDDGAHTSPGGTGTAGGRRAD